MYLLSTPDELTSTLLNEKVRPLWDLGATKAEKLSEDCLRITYTNIENQSITETIKYSFIPEKDGTLLI